MRPTSVRLVPGLALMAILPTAPSRGRTKSSTNFLDLSWQRSVRMRGVESTVRGSVEWHVRGTYDPDEMREYSKLRLYDVSPRFDGLDRFQVWLTLGWAPSRRSDLLRPATLGLSPGLRDQPRSGPERDPAAAGVLREGL
jgi:hypothetical protein